MKYLTSRGTFLVRMNGLSSMKLHCHMKLKLKLIETSKAHRNIMESIEEELEEKCSYFLLCTQKRLQTSCFKKENIGQNWRYSKNVSGFNIIYCISLFSFEQPDTTINIQTKCLNWQYVVRLGQWPCFEWFIKIPKVKSFFVFTWQNVAHYYGLTDVSLLIQGSIVHCIEFSSECEQIKYFSFHVSMDPTYIVM